MMPFQISASAAMILSNSSGSSAAVPVRHETRLLNSSDLPAADQFARQRVDHLLREIRGPEQPVEVTAGGQSLSVSVTIGTPGRCGDGLVSTTASGLSLPDSRYGFSSTGEPATIAT